MLLKNLLSQNSTVLSKRFQYTFGSNLGNNKNLPAIRKDDNLKKEIKEKETINMAYASYENSDTSVKNEPTPLLIMHGVFGSKSNWTNFSKTFHAKAKPSKRAVYSVDFRNHADSPFTENHNYDNLVMDIKQFIENMGLNKVSLLGHCMGGRACMLFALKYPEKVEKLIVEDISPVTTSMNFKSLSALFTILKSLKMPKNMPLSQGKMEINRQLVSIVSNKHLREFILNNLVMQFDGSYNWSLNLPTLMKNYENIAGFPDIHNLNFEGPVLFIGGGKSDFIQKSDLPKIKKLFPKAELKFIEGAGHWLHAEKPSEFLNLTLNFLNK